MAVVFKLVFMGNSIVSLLEGEDDDGTHNDTVIGRIVYMILMILTLIISGTGLGRPQWCPGGQGGAQGFGCNIS